MMKFLREWRAAKQWFVWDGHEIAYWTGGSGPPLMLIHGFPTSSFDWHYVWESLTQRFSVVALDMLGFGLSDKPTQHSYLITEQARLHHVLAIRLGIASTHVLAHDYGVTVAQELLARQREGKQHVTLESVVYLNGGLYPEHHRPTRGQELLLSKDAHISEIWLDRDMFRMGLMQVFGPHTQPAEAEIDDLWELLCEQNGNCLLPETIDYVRQRKANRERWVGALEAALVPQRFINGVLDPVSGGHMADHYARAVPNADVVRLEDIGHWPQIEAPERVLAAFFEFHDKLASGVTPSR